MSSNCYVVYDENSRHCIIIDPGSEKSLREIGFIEEKKLELDYIIMTHEHTDHNWGVNALRERYNTAKLICSEFCNRFVKKTSYFYFLYYYDNADYRYEIETADVIISNQKETLEWGDYKLHFLLTPGHSHGSMCIGLENMLFSGDTIMPTKPYFNGRDSDENEWYESVKRVLLIYKPCTIVFPGHENPLTLQEWGKLFYEGYDGYKKRYKF